MSYLTNYGKVLLGFIYKDRGTSFLVFKFIDIKHLYLIHVCFRKIIIY